MATTMTGLSKSLVATSIACGIGAGVAFWLTVSVPFLMPKWLVCHSTVRRVQAAVQRLQRRRRPQRIILVRHGQSRGNVDHHEYARTPDNRVALTDLGIEQARAVGIKLREVVGTSEVKFFLSPYKRTRQTFEHISAAFDESQIRKVVEDPRLREQDFANFQVSPLEGMKEGRRMMEVPASAR